MYKRYVSLICVFTMMALLTTPTKSFATVNDSNLKDIGLNQIYPNIDGQRIIVKFRKNTSASAKAKALNKYNDKKAKKIASDSYIVEASEAVPAESLLELYEQIDTIEYAEPDYKAVMSSIPNDPYYSNQAATLQAMHVVDAWDITKGDPNVVVAVLDTGVDFGHPDLFGQLLSGYDYVNLDSDPSDDNGHGTMCSGIIAACIDNATGISGAVDCSVLPVKVLDAEGSGYVSDIVQGITYAVAHGANIISMSFGTTNYSQSLQDALNEAHKAGVILVAASGNSNSSVNYPGANANVIAVGAVTSSLVRASYSCYGSDLDLVAVGSNVISTCYDNGESSYAQGSGTSFAAPYVSALAAILLSIDPGLSPDEVENIMKDTATDLGDPGCDDYYGHGCVDYSVVMGQFSGDNSTPERTGTEDVSPPVITILGDNEVTIENGHAYVDAGALAYDEVDGDLTDNIIVNNTVDVSVDGVYSVTYTVSDAAGNTATAIRAVTVKANVKPVIIINGYNSVKWPTGMVYKDMGATAYDAEDGDITPLIVTSGKVNTSRVGTYQITYSATDSHGAVGSGVRTVVVYKNTRPVIKLVGASRVTVPFGSDYIDSGATAQDLNDGTLTSSIITTGSVNTLKAGSYPITYTVTDSGGLKASITRIVKVKPNSKPTIKLFGGKSVTVLLGSSFNDAGASAIDAEDGNLSSSIVTTGFVNTSVKGTYYVTYTVADQFGLAASVKRAVRVK